MAQTAPSTECEVNIGLARDIADAIVPKNHKKCRLHWAVLEHAEAPRQYPGRRVRLDYLEGLRR